MASHDPLSLDGMDEIPDPAARVAAAAVVAPPECRPPSERSPTRAERGRRAWAAVLVALAWIGAAVVISGVRPDVASKAVAAPIAAWALGGAVVLAIVLRPRARGLPAGVRAVQHAVWIVPAAYVVGVVFVAAPGDEPLTWASIRGCIAVSTVITLGPLVAAALFLRRSFLSAPGWRGAAVGGLAGLAGSIGVHAHCPCQGLGHLLAAHGAAIAIGAAAGGALGRLGGRS